MKSTGFRNASAAWNGCERCHGKGIAGESAEGCVPGDISIRADTSGFLVIVDDQGRDWKIDQDEAPAELAAFFDNQRQRAHAHVDARFDRIRAVLERRAMLPDELFVPVLPSRLLDLEEEEARKAVERL